ncbi:hypothetical protein B9J77_00015 [candidate division NPL-UPA2 bacterium Unc8]|uniref:Transposase IS200-like domain-containing protein n=1 Tax=candidate division NPL-UPA2 bacterium Unc8 TaxID=1980939 RepID=A0A399FXV5_UNCN2|nr:MAG: hypothetical protein B9J77_00015 [candidate division NPL-UPA2 bacterium Unc8]
MGRALRIDISNEIYHVLNRANARMTIFEKDNDYQAFETIIEEAKDHYPIKIFSYQIMPNHWHFCLCPQNDGDITKFMQWLTLTHAQRWHVSHCSIGAGHLYQGRYKSFLVQKDNYLLQLCRYIESNALRTKLVQKAEDWRWSSLWRREHGTDKQKELLSPWPIAIPVDYLEQVNIPLTKKELEYVRISVVKNRPYGKDNWVDAIVKKFALEITIRYRGRPKKGS